MISNFVCLRLPEDLPNWCNAKPLHGTNGYWHEVTVDAANPELQETLEGDYDDPIAFPDLLNALGFDGIQLEMEWIKE